MGGGGQLISVYPEELTFEFELDKPSYCNLKVVNNTEHHVAFKLLVTLQAQKEFPPDMQSKDKFLLQSTRVPPNTDMDELPPDTFNKDGDKVIEELKLRVVYMAPSQSGRGNSEGDLGFTSRSLKHGSDDLSMLKNSSIEEIQTVQRLKEERDTALQQNQQLQHGEKYMESEGDCHQLFMANGSLSIPKEVHFSVADVFTKNALSVGTSAKGHSSSILNQRFSLSPSIVTSGILLNFESRNIEYVGECETEKLCKNTQGIVMNEELLDFQKCKNNYRDMDINANVPEATTLEKIKISELEMAVQQDIVTDKSTLHEEILREESRSQVTAQLSVINELSLTGNIIVTEKELNVLPTETGTLNSLAAGLMERPGATKAISCLAEDASHSASALRMDHQNFIPVGQTASKLESSAIHPQSDPKTIHKQKKKSFVRPRNMGGVGTTVGLQSLNGVPENKREGNSSKQEQAKRDGQGLIMKQNTRRSHNQVMPTKENRVDAASKTLKSHFEPKLLPDFESFTIEEEEGSGGYGTVYRARRNVDGKIFAVKCM
ncbi:putative Vesicle-associated protein 1-3 [Cocos nucifera]|uniref:Putative Vesicle-associated protein 1-3 n=1 Tax=Cocos nucifera TaxID=13894 RepID=A0A8K0IEH3_COCNU|nr:putative Vesicle-associated protein 1-3 [Cocos nucifera]